MATPHKKAERTVEIVSDLPADQLAAICKEAADQCKLQLDKATPGQLVFSFRSLILPSKNYLLVFEVRLSHQDDRHVMRSGILRYKTRQQKFLAIIPTEPKRLVGLSGYEKFMRRFGELVRQADAQADVSITG